jgi:hypothetical protein
VQLGNRYESADSPPSAEPAAVYSTVNDAVYGSADGTGASTVNDAVYASADGADATTTSYVAGFVPPHTLFLFGREDGIGSSPAVVERIGSDPHLLWSRGWDRILTCCRMAMKPASVRFNHMPSHVFSLSLSLSLLSSFFFLSLTDCAFYDVTVHQG